MTKPHLTDLQKSTLLDKWCSTPLSMQDFCHQENISISSFNRWRQQLTAPSEIHDASTDWIEIEPSKQGEPSVLPDPTSNWNVELVLPGDIILRIRY
ncbi:IS66 family insertion sequence element accessory protein TnpA [Shewanella surugensis]|uniref:IS66 family insertion sequence element accessory protein TnpB n=1 Tax=Shewanella surugensis TaxID=212020 RepID=A0ABT0LJW2_9GAMM|nr:hypothetical protein [Shewanella surugensis]MCL1127660.1 hypothetical protein [Shewanella surugensis]